MFRDNEGFLYPVIDSTSCINCGLCDAICPVINKGQERNPLECYAAINNDEDIRYKSSSGGIFHLLAKKIIEEDFKTACDNGYLVVSARVLHAADYGVPQSRERVI